MRDVAQKRESNRLPEDMVKVKMDVRRISKEEG